MDKRRRASLMFVIVDDGWKHVPHKTILNRSFCTLSLFGGFQFHLDDFQIFKIFWGRLFVAGEGPVPIRADAGHLRQTLIHSYMSYML